MLSDDLFALHITWTCYGTWLPGDPRGYVSNTILSPRGFVPKANTPGTPVTANDPTTFQNAKVLQKFDTAYLTPALAFVVAEALVKAAAERGWRILRGAVMANHVHAVVMDCPKDGPAVRRILKGVSQASLCDHVGKSQRWWTAGGSNRYKDGEDAINAAVQYVANQPGMLVSIEDMQVRIV